MTHKQTQKFSFIFEQNATLPCYNIRKPLNESLSIARNVIMIGLLGNYSCRDDSYFFCLKHF